MSKSLKDWKLPPSSSSDSFLQNGTNIKTVEKSISLPPGYSSIPLLSKLRKRAHSICNAALFVGAIELALIPSNLGSNTCAIIRLRDTSYSSSKLTDSVLAMVETSLSDGPIHFPYFPTDYVSLSSPRSRNDFTVDVKIEGYESVTLMYKFYYELIRGPSIGYSPVRGNDDKGETTFFLTSIARSNRVVSKKCYWNQTGVSKGLMVDDDLSFGGACSVDWRETVGEHVLKADVPGFKREEVQVVVEDGGVLVISGERRNEEGDEWHRLERSGKLLRRLRLPENANLEKMEAAMENGVLTVTVPKVEAGQRKVIDVACIDHEVVVF